MFTHLYVKWDVCTVTSSSNSNTTSTTVQDIRNLPDLSWCFMPSQPVRLYQVITWKTFISF